MLRRYYRNRSIWNIKNIFASAVFFLLGCTAFGEQNYFETRFNHSVEYYFPDQEQRNLAKAAAIGNEDEVKRLVKNGVKTNMLGTDGITPLLWSVGAGSAVGVETLLELGADPNMADLGGSTPLSIAIYLKNAKIVEILLKAKATINVNPDETKRRDFLYIAVLYSSDEIVKLLLAYGADPNSSKGYQNALSTSISIRRYSVSLLLLDYGAQPRVNERIEKELVLLVKKEISLAEHPEEFQFLVGRLNKDYGFNF